MCVQLFHLIYFILIIILFFNSFNKSTTIMLNYFTVNYLEKFPPIIFLLSNIMEAPGFTIKFYENENKK